jgi:hypothetical protein
VLDVEGDRIIAMFSPRVPNSVASSKKVKTVVERLHSIFGLFEKSQQLHIMVFWSIPPQEKNALSFCSPQPCTKTFIEKTAHILADPLAFFILEPFYEQIKQPQGSTYKGGRSRIIIWLGNEASDVTHVVSSRRLGNPGLEPNAVPKSHSNSTAPNIAVTDYQAFNPPVALWKS